MRLFVAYSAFYLTSRAFSCAVNSGYTPSRQLTARTRAFESESKDRKRVQPECNAWATCKVSSVPAFNFVPKRSINCLDLSDTAFQSNGSRCQMPVPSNDSKRVQFSEFGLPIRKVNARRHSNSASSLNMYGSEFFLTNFSAAPVCPCQ